MPEAQETFRNAISILLEAVMFENWLRFYFIAERPSDNGEDEPALLISVPDKGMKRIAEQASHLLPLAQAMNGREVTFEISRRAVCEYVLHHVEGKRLPTNQAAIVFESALFQVELQLFNTWVQIHEDQLDEHFLEFGTWRDLFDEWRQTPAARELSEKLLCSSQGQPHTASA